MELELVPGNSQRKGSVRKTSKKPTAGSGGRVRRGLEGKGPTPKAKDRPYHKTHKNEQRAQKKAAALGRARPRAATTSGWPAATRSSSCSARTSR